MTPACVPMLYFVTMLLLLAMRPYVCGGNCTLIPVLILASVCGGMSTLSTLYKSYPAAFSVACFGMIASVCVFLCLCECVGWVGE